MSDAAPAKPKKVAKPNKAPTHPKYIEMIKKSIASLKERGGSSRQAILKQILKDFNVGTDEKAVNGRLKLALKAGVTKGILKQSKGSGASGSFRLGEAEKTKKPKAKKTSAAKPKPKKPKAKKPAGEKAKKAKSPKKKAAAKPKKSPAKKAPKPKKSPVKKAAKKAKSPKKPAKKAAKK
jgi:hypothetical protein